MAEKLTAAEFRGYAQGVLKKFEEFYEDFYEGRNGEPSYKDLIINTHIRVEEIVTKQDQRKQNWFQIFLVVLNIALMLTVFLLFGINII